MRILIHDYSGHPPQVRVSRELSRLGHEVFYLYAETNQTPNGNLTEETSKKNIFHIVGVGTSTPLQKYNYFRRQLQEVAYSKPLIEAVKETDPDVVVCSDTPLFPLNALRSYCLSTHIPFVLWMMDVQSSSIRNWACRHLPLLGSLVGSAVTKFEEYIARKSDYIILASEDFRKTVDHWKISPDRFRVLPLWAPLDEISIRPKENEWAHLHGLLYTTNVIYAGTLGLSHSAHYFIEMAKVFAHRSDVKIVVITEGPNASYLMNKKKIERLENLLVLPYQDYHTLPDVFGTADILVAVLNDEAADHSAPGKVLSHLCAGKPQLAVMPQRNLMSRIVLESGGGIVADPLNVDAVLSAAERLIDDPETRRKMGRSARRYAERKFDISRIGREFESIVMPPLAGGKFNGQQADLQI